MHKHSINYNSPVDFTLEISCLRLNLFNEIEGVGLSINAPLGGLNDKFFSRNYLLEGIFLIAIILMSSSCNMDRIRFIFRVWVQISLES